MDIRLPLPAALRHRVPAKENLWAHFISLILSPPVVWTVWIYAVSLPSAEDIGAALFFASLFAGSICILPMLFVALMVRLGKIGDLHMRESRERFIPYSIAITLGLISELIFLRLEAAPIFLIVTLVSIVELGIILLGTFFAHISLHAMAMSSIVAATAVMYSFNQSLVFLPALLLVILARLVLQRHTAVQVLLGVLIGLLTPLAVVGFWGALL